MRIWIAAVTTIVLATVGAGSSALADTPVATISDTSPDVGQEIDVEMICEPDDDAEPLVPTFEMLAPGGGSTVDPVPGSVSGDAGSVFASWVFESAGLYQLVVSCNGDSETFDITVGGPPVTSTTTTVPGNTLPATGAAAGSTGAASMGAVGFVVLGGTCALAARRRTH